MTVRRIFPKTIPAATQEEASYRARSLFREWLREAPRAVNKFPLNLSVAEFRARIRFEFEQNRNVQDLNARNILILKWTMELIETHNKWKQRLHLMRLFDTGEWAAIKQRARNPRFLPASTPGVSTFLAEFLAPRTGL